MDGKRITLGENREQAMDEFHRLMLNRNQVAAAVTTVYELSQCYLSWVEVHRKPGTYENHKRYLESFINAVGRTVKVSRLKRRHVTDWSEKYAATTTQNDAISIVNRMFNWAIEKEYFDYNPIANIKKPRRRRREIVYTPGQWQEIRKHATGPLVPLLDFLWLTGCRPLEARALERRHVHDHLIIFPPDESKGETDSRVIFITDTVRRILLPLLENGKSGPLFRNSKGRPWTKDAIKCRLNRISQKVGFRVIAYGARHSYATNALIRSVDAVSLSHLMGHRDTRMINNYAHLAQNVEFLRKQANRASGAIGGVT
ncbi:site-specific integrase [Roseiconus nitratireducens]|uniref:Site-specific integrase n=1 Tax=Roseiconus nitratireducens TaxID=2605748 RepID=A0A5M6CYY6_9BACT|nr:site-specific integrase [Roseiconus nitratireducens]